MVKKTNPTERLIYDTKVKAFIRGHYGEALVTKEFLRDLNEHNRRIVLDSLEHPDNQSKFIKTLCAGGPTKTPTKVLSPPLLDESKVERQPTKTILKVNPNKPQDILVSYRVHVQGVELSGVYAVRTRVSLDEIRTDKAQIRVRTQLANAGIDGWADAVVLVTDIRPYEPVSNV